MKKLIMSLLMICISMFSIAQSLKTYSGAYSISYSYLTSGQATYTYFEKDGLDIKQGQFSFTGTKTNYTGGLTIKINGQYKNNLKSGLWNYNFNAKDNISSEISMIMKANYSNGVPNGVWTVSLNLKNNTENVTVTSKLNSNFKEGCFVGAFNFTLNSPEETSEVIIQLDDKGYYLSEKRRENQNSTIINYYKNVLVDEVYGYDKTKEIVDKIEQYANQPDTLKEIPYKITKTKGSMPKDSHDALFSMACLFHDITGDVNYISTGDDNKVNYKYDGFNYYVIEPQKTLTDFYNEKVTSGDNVFGSGDYKRAIALYNQALEYKKVDYASKRIVECEKLIAEIEERKQKENRILQEQNKIKIKQYILDGDSNFVNYRFNESMQAYEKANSLEKNEYASRRIRQIFDYMRNTEKYVQMANEFSNNYVLDSAIHYYKISYYFYPQHVGIINSLSWVLILNKNYTEAQKLLEYAKTIEPNNLYIKLNTAHCYLFINEFEKALNLYNENIDAMVGDVLWQDGVIADFNIFIGLGIKNDYFVEVAKKLKRRKQLNWKE